jgi:hypothetical protein
LNRNFGRNRKFEPNRNQNRKSYRNQKFPITRLHIIITFRIQFNKSTPKKIYIKCDRTFILSLLSCIFSFAKRVKLLEVGHRTLYLATITIHRYLTLNIVTNACNIFQLKMVQV